MAFILALFSFISLIAASQSAFIPGLDAVVNFQSAFTPGLDAAGAFHGSAMQGLGYGMGAAQGALYGAAGQMSGLTNGLGGSGYFDGSIGNVLEATANGKKEFGDVLVSKADGLSNGITQNSESGINMMENISKSPPAKNVADAAGIKASEAVSFKPVNAKNGDTAHGTNFIGENVTW